MINWLDFLDMLLSDDLGPIFDIYFLQVSIRNNWHESLYNFKAYNMMVCFTDIMKWSPQ